MHREAISRGQVIQGCAAQKAWHCVRNRLRSRPSLRRMNQPARHPDPISPVLPLKKKIGAVRWEVRSGVLSELCEPLLREPDQLSKDKSRVVHETWAVTVVRVPAATGP